MCLLLLTPFSQCPTIIIFFLLQMQNAWIIKNKCSFIQQMYLLSSSSSDLLEYILGREIIFVNKCIRSFSFMKYSPCSYNSTCQKQKLSLTGRVFYSNSLLTILMVLHLSLTLLWPAFLSRAKCWLYLVAGILP